MNNRARFFRLLENREIDRVPFFPDISTWYENTRKNPGEEEIFGPGVYIPDNVDFHSRESRLSGQMGKMTCLDFYREFDWGLPVHIYDWYRVDYDGDIQHHVRKEGKVKITTFDTPKGTLEAKSMLAADGSWAPREYFIKDIKELDIVKYILENRKIVPFFDGVETFLEETKGFGVCDLVVWRSPFGKLVHELMGFENVIYALFDNERVIIDVLEFMEFYDLKLIELAAESPARIVIVSDHADENLISPPHYRKYCFPFYQKASSILHNKGKFLSTHLDGNIKGYLPFITEAGFDLLDGCTPAPMFNYEVEELAESIGTDLICYCGVPASLLVQQLPTECLTDFGRRIVSSFQGRVIANIGDILPPEGDIHKVIEVGKAVMEG